MEGIKQNFHTEKNLENTNTTVVVSEESAIESGPPPPAQPTVLDESGMLSLEAILPSILGCKEVWPQKVLAAVIERFGRMPRNGWTITRAYFNNKFQIDISPDVFKKKAQETLVTASGKQCSSRQYKLEPVKRVKTIDEIIEKRTLFEVKIFNKVKLKLLSRI